MVPAMGKMVTNCFSQLSFGSDGLICTGKVTNYVPELRLHELRAEKYNGLVRLLKPGCRTIVLLTDMQSRNKLIPAFHKAVWPYRKYGRVGSRDSQSFR